MTFLSKLGGILAKGLAIATGLEPLIGGFFGSGPEGQKAAAATSSAINDLSQIAQTVTMVEAVIQTPGSGAAKLSAATPLVANIIKTSEIVSGKKIVNEALFVQGCQEIASAMADVLNSLDPNAAQTAPGPAIVVPAVVKVAKPV